MSQAHSSTRQRAQTHSKALLGIFKGRNVLAFDCHVSSPVQKIFSGHAHVVERGEAIVDAVEASFSAHVANYTTGK